MIKSLLIDKDADIRNVAAESIHIIFKKSIYSSSPQQNDEWINICWKMLWEELKPILDILKKEIKNYDHEKIRKLLILLVPSFKPQSEITDILYKKINI